MSLAPPPYFFRLRDNGAVVFRVSDGGRNARIEMERIATVNVRNGEVRPQGGKDLTDRDEAAIRDWLAARRARLAAREAARGDDLVEALNNAAHWAQNLASAEDLEAVTDDLLMAMHDLRQVLVRRKAQQR